MPISRDFRPKKICLRKIWISYLVRDINEVKYAQQILDIVTTMLVERISLVGNILIIWANALLLIISIV